MSNKIQLAASCELRVRAVDGGFVAVHCQQWHGLWRATGVGEGETIDDAAHKACVASADASGLRAREAQEKLDAWTSDDVGDPW